MPHNNTFLEPGRLERNRERFSPGGLGGQAALAGATGGASVGTQLAFQGGGAVLELIGELFGGDGGDQRRLQTAETSANKLANTQFNQRNIAQQRSGFEQGILSPFVQRLQREASAKTGQGSGIGQAFVLENAQQAGAAFESRAIQSELERVLRQRLAGFGGQLRLAG